jgi:hypothetical protein
MTTLAAICMRAVARVLPPHRAEWAQAMRVEFDHLNDDRERLRWALGCLTTAIRQRLMPMNTGSFRISRWVMLIETLGCFAPLTIAWFEVTFGASGIVRLSPAIIEKYYLPEPGGLFIVSMWISGAFIGLIGPIGLFLGLRYVLRGQALRNRAFGFVLIAAPTISAIVGSIWGYIAGPPDFSLPFGATLMFTILPVAGIAHLMYLAKQYDRALPLAAV